MRQRRRFRMRVALVTEPLEVIGHGYHDDYRDYPPKYLEVARRSHGRIVTVDSPVKPSAKWKCGTDLVWPVVEDPILRETERTLAYVCRHQIVAGD